MNTNEYKMVKWPITETMHAAACKVLLRASGMDGLPSRMIEAMTAAAPSVPSDRDSVIEEMARFFDLNDRALFSGGRVADQLRALKSQPAKPVADECHKQANDYCKCSRGAMLCDGFGPDQTSIQDPRDEVIRLLRKKFEHIREYWNGDSNFSAMGDALIHIEDVAEEAIAAIDSLNIPKEDRRDDPCAADLAAEYTRGREDGYEAGMLFMKQKQAEEHKP